MSPMTKRQRRIHPGRRNRDTGRKGGNRGGRIKERRKGETMGSEIEVQRVRRRKNMRRRKGENGKQ